MRDAPHQRWTLTIFSPVQRPFLLKGHSRPLTHVKFNREGDLLFSAAKDHTPCVWYAHNGERLGTFNGHNGTVYALDINFDTTRLVTASADRSVKLWDIKSGQELHRSAAQTRPPPYWCSMLPHSFPHKSMVRSVGWSEGDTMILTAQDQSFSQQPTVFIYNIAEDSKDRQLCCSSTPAACVDYGFRNYGACQGAEGPDLWQSQHCLVGAAEHQDHLWLSRRRDQNVGRGDGRPGTQGARAQNGHQPCVLLARQDHVHHGFG